MLTLSKHFQVKGHCCHVILSSLFALGNPFINGMLIHAIVGKFIQLFLSFLLNLDKNKFLRMKVQNINPISHGEKQKCAYLYVLYLKIYRCVCMCVCVCVHACLRGQSCATLCNSMDYKPPGFSVHGIL